MSEPNNPMVVHGLGEIVLDATGPTHVQAHRARPEPVDADKLDNESDDEPTLTLWSRDPDVLTLDS